MLSGSARRTDNKERGQWSGRSEICSGRCWPSSSGSRSSGCSSSIFADVLRRDLSGWAKAGWIVLIVVLPFLGTLIYLIATPRMTAEDIGLRCSPRPPGF